MFSYKIDYSYQMMLMFIFLINHNKSAMNVNNRWHLILTHKHYANMNHAKLPCVQVAEYI